MAEKKGTSITQMFIDEAKVLFDPERTLSSVALREAERSMAEFQKRFERTVNIPSYMISQRNDWMDIWREFATVPAVFGPFSNVVSTPTPEERKRIDKAIMSREVRETQQYMESAQRRFATLQAAQDGHITADMITGEQNSEIRRIMLDRFGFERYVQEGGFRVFAKDNFGELLIKNIDSLDWRPRRDSLVAVRVLNSTPDWHPATNDKQENCGHERLRVKHHDVRCRHCGRAGHYRTYILRVPPNMRTPREAIAWTFGLEEHQYQPLQMT